jgi:toxin YoeB
LGKKKTEAISEQPPQRQIPRFTQQFKDDLGWWYKTDRSKVDKIFMLITAVISDPFQGIGKPEPLKYLGADLWSRRIDLEHRLVCRVSHQQIDFLICRYHYE